jgi:peptidoglycan/LPS O-acetylase OafA/YrhL
LAGIYGGALKRFAGLELCRFLCALAVLICHYQFFSVKGLWVNDLIPATYRTSFPFYQILFPFYEKGYFAVQVFWVISGFIFFWKYGDAVHDRSINASTFGVWRFSRLYPLHFVTLLAVALMQPIYQFNHAQPFLGWPNDTTNFLLQLAMASNWFSWTPNTFNVPVWSVSAEILAYVAFFLLVRMVRPGIILCACVVVVTNQYGRGIPWVECAQFFFAGGLLQRVLMRIDPKYQVIPFWGAVCVAAVVLVLERLGFAIGMTPLLFLSTSIVAAFSLLDTIVKWDMRGLSRLGDLTYASYLVHFPLQLAVVIVVDALGIARTTFLSPGTFCYSSRGHFFCRRSFITTSSVSTKHNPSSLDLKHQGRYRRRKKPASASIASLIPSVSYRRCSPNAAFAKLEMLTAERNQQREAAIGVRTTVCSHREL